MLLCSCQDNKKNKGFSKQNHNVDTIQVYEKPETNFEFSELTTDHEIIDLETTPESLLGKIHKVLFADSLIFVLDIDIAKGVLMFNRKGKFIRKIGDIGKGFGEYMAPHDMYLDRSANELTIYDKKKKKLMKYAYDGKFKGEENINLNLRDIEKVNKDSLIAFSPGLYNHLEDFGDLPYDLLAFDSKGKILNKQFPNETKLGEGTTVLTFNRYFSRAGKDMYLSWLLNDTIYKINDQINAIPVLAVDFGEKRISDEAFNNNSIVEVFKKVVSGEYWAIIRPIQIAGSQLMIAFGAEIDPAHPNDNYRILYDLKTGNNFQFHNLKYGGEECKWTLPMDTHDGFFVSVLTPENRKCFKEEPTLHDEVANEEFANPSLLLYKFKPIEQLKNEN